MPRSRSRRLLALLTAAAVLASMSAATVSSPASAAKPKPKCQGKTATIVGTRKNDIIRGTARRDIIVAKGGNDRIYGRGGNDLICAGPGNDLVYGGLGADTIWGQLGRDRLNGNAGPDFLAGQAANDQLNGGLGVDTCYQGPGIGAVLSCERPAPPPPPAPAPPPPPQLIDLDANAILAVAYSDIDGLDGYSTGDVLIARLRDTSGDGQPNTGDTIEMGRYPLNLEATAFGDWLDKTHVVASTSQDTATTLRLETGDGTFLWFKISTGEAYQEDAGPASSFDDGFDAFDDMIEVQTGSPSFPQTPISIPSRTNGIDDAFINVVLNYPVP